ncbi:MULTISPECIES: thiol reductant ABC exporter subunit CydD [Rhodobacterales]|uniref:thiol reductant ABC exporter subunit CydD n=1 Tax=Rhodobacterales TaxID=204455 RepID=UPI00215D88E5|nr:MULTISPECIES: thiol reductant ABC exporter subunit CydD [Rhodobacterales]MDO6592149.1 thiol reductant ABC exporter subunit CydD [Yoonia sp. 1_MG-2023]
MPAQNLSEPQTPADKPAKGWLAPGHQNQRKAARLAVIASLIWPFQAWLVAFALGGLLTGETVSAAFVASGFIALGLLRAVLVYMSEKHGEKAAIKVIRAARALIVGREAMRAEACDFGGAGSIAALAGEKLDLLAPFITRYAPARARVMVVPLVILALAVWQSWAVAVIFVISGPLIPVFMALVGMAAKEASRDQMAEVGTLNDLLVERLSAVVDIRLLGAQDAVLSGFETQAQGLRQRTMAVLRVAFLSSTVLELFAAIGVAMIAVYVGFSLLGALEFGAWGGTVTPQVGIFLLLLAPEFYQPLRDLAAAWHDKAAADAVLEELSAWDRTDTQTLMGQGGPSARLDGPASVELRGASLHGGIALNDFEIRAGETVALMGASGTGKTSTLRAIAGLVQPVAGDLMVAGHPLNSETADPWRARIGWMPQAPHFLNASLRYNLTLGDGGDPTDALKQAAVMDVVAGLPQGLHTRLGETGGGLSGGEARRVTLARAIYSKPDIILADEPTADLDAQTAAAVTEGLLAQAAKGVTLIVATHDAALAAKMDRIITIGGAQ